jgi:hypothetical protein
LALRLLDANGTLIRDLYKEKNPGPGRFCPTGYGIAEVRIMPRGQEPPVLAMIVGMDSPGGKGQDRRYAGFVVDLAKPAEGESSH